MARETCKICEGPREPDSPWTSYCKECGRARHRARYRKDRQAAGLTVVPRKGSRREINEAFQRMDGKQGLCMGCGAKAVLHCVDHWKDGWHPEAVSLLCETCLHVLAVLLSYPSLTPTRAEKLCRLVAKYNMTPETVTVGIPRVVDEYLNRQSE